MKASFVFFFSSFIFLILVLLITRPTPAPLQQKSSSVITISDSQEWANCNDIRDFIEDGSKRYLACHGGVLVLDDNNQVVDQITMADGLANHIATSLIKKENKLFIGTQDGVTVFDLSTRMAKKISVAEGLVNGSNILLKEDGDYLWVGTFNGISKIDTRDLSIQNFTSELGPSSPVHNVRGLLVTTTSVYVAYVAGGDSVGGIARYDKSLGTWEYWTPSDFMLDGAPKERLDFGLISEENGQILVGVPNEAWQSPNDPQGTWTKVTQSSFHYPEPKTLVLAGRPLTFDDLLTVVDSHLFFSSGNSIWKLNLQDFTFSQVLSLPLEVQSNILFMPIEGSTKIFIHGQSCGLGCGEPKFYIYDYSNAATIPVKSPKMSAKNQYDFPQFLPLFKTATLDEPLNFSVISIGLASLDPIKLTWSITEGNQPPPDRQENLCVSQFSFEGTGLFGLPDGCTTANVTVPQITMAPEKYSPFGWPDKVTYQPSFLVQNLVWTGSNRGLTVFSPQTGQARLISTSDGLTSNQVDQYIVLPNQLIVKTDAGLSVLKYK